MRRRAEGQAACSEPKANKKDPEEKQPRQTEATSRMSYSSVLLNFGKCFLLFIVIPPFLNYASLQREEQMLMPQDGRVVDVGLGQKMHLLCKGRGTPVVVLDAPAGMSSDVWLHVQESVSSVTQVCTYDRVGLGFSKRAFPNETTGTEKVWGLSTTGRMVDDLQRLLRAANISMPFILVGSELGALNSRFYSHIHDVQVSDLVLIDPIPEDVFEEEQWNEYWYGKLLPSLHAQQLSAAAGLSRILIILGVLEPSIKGENVSEEVIQRQLVDECEQFVKTPCSPLPATHGLMAAVMRDPFQLFNYYSCCQGDKDIIVEEFSKDGKKGFVCRLVKKYLLSNPIHQSSAVDEHYFMNESAAQVRDITKFKPLSSMISVSMLTGDLFDEQMPEHLNQMVAKLQTRFLKESYPTASHIHIKGADRRMIYKKPSAISQHLRRLVNQRQVRQQSE